MPKRAAASSAAQLGSLPQPASTVDAVLLTKFELANGLLLAALHSKLDVIAALEEHLEGLPENSFTRSFGIAMIETAAHHLHQSLLLELDAIVVSLLGADHPMP